MFRLGDSREFKTFEDERNERKAKAKKAARNKRNRKNKARRRIRKAEWKANNPKPERVEDVLKAVSESRKRANV